jgi:tRNA pseudouridine55 synthase
VTSPAFHPTSGGLVVVDKDPGLTSHDVVTRARRALDLRRVGHTGTLDPMASGVLVLLLGRATRLARLLSGHPKAYEGEGRLGWSTDTYDRTGRAVSPPREATDLDEPRVRAAAAALTGEVLQSPPPYSARKVDGVPLYRRARKGEPAVGRPVAVTVSRFDVALAEPGTIRFQALVSSGTYIRSLVHELGQALGCGAHLTALRRTAAGPFSLATALALAELERDGRAALAPPSFLSLDKIPLELPVVHVSPEEAMGLGHGRPFRAEVADEKPELRLVQARDGAGRLLALAVPSPDLPGRFQPKTVFLAPPEPPGGFTPREASGTFDRNQALKNRRREEEKSAPGR